MLWLALILISFPSHPHLNSALWWLSLPRSGVQPLMRTRIPMVQGGSVCSWIGLLRYHNNVPQTGGLKQQTFVVWDQGINTVGFFFGLSPCLVNDRPLSAFSRGLPSVYACVSISPSKDIRYIGLGPALMTSFFHSHPSTNFPFGNQQLVLWVCFCFALFINLRF